MRRFFMLTLAMLLLISSSAFADVAITSTNFPDETFRNLLIEYEESAGDGDGWLSSEEAATITSINVSEEGITSLKGIEYLTELEAVDCSQNQLAELDLSKNTKLAYLLCWDNQLTELNLSNNTELLLLVCNYNQITNLDLSGLSKLFRLECDNNGMEVLNLSGNSELQLIWCQNNNLSELDLSGSPKLSYMNCSDNQFTTLDLTMCPNLQELDCYDAVSLRELDVSGLTQLVSLDCHYNPFMVSLDVSGCSGLVSLFCQNSMFLQTQFGGISELDLSSSTKLRNLNCGFNKLAELDLSNKPELIFLNCQGNNLSGLDVNSCAKLERMSCGSNQISELDVGRCAELVYLNCNWNWLSALDVSNNRKLETLYCSDNNIKELHLSNNTSLKDIECRNNNIAALDLTGLTLSTGLDYLGGQVVGHLVVKHQPDEDESYPYYVDFSRYMSASQTNNVIPSSVQGFDDNNEEIATVYSSGTVRFAELPAVVKYNYRTGIGSVSSDVSIVNNDYTSLSLNNHVYRVFPRSTMWTNAKEYCESLGGHLVTISGDAERELVQELCRRAHDVLGFYWAAFWTGGERIGLANTENRWKWVTDEPFTEVVSEDLTDLLNAEDPMTDLSEDTQIGEMYFRNLAMSVSGVLIKGPGALPLYGFICEWEPEATDFAPYSEEYQKYIADPEAYFDEGSFRGAIPEPVDYSHLAANPPVFTASEKAAFSVSALESRYDPRDMGTVSPVRDQTHDYRTCWTFAALGTLETSYIHQGYGTTAPDLSELHMAWYTYMDPRKDYREQIHEKFADQPILQAGGTSSIAVAFLSRAGVVAEDDMPYTDTETLGKLYSNDVLQDNRFPEEYSHPLRIKEAYVLGDITADNRDIVKSLIKQYGAVSAAYDAKEHYDSDKAYYYDSQINSGHAVSIVGWDDNYSRDNFSNMPKAGGAWLAKNSYGTDAGEGGFFWLSYEQRIGGAAVYVAADSKVNKLYGHDMIAAKDTIPHNWSAVILRAEDDETFSEVSFHTRNNNVSYEVYINKLGSDTEPSKPGIPGTPAASGTISMAGYHTITLDAPLEVKAGEYFSVMLKLEDKSTYGYLSAVEDTGVIRSASTVTVAGKSYFADVAGALPVSADWKDGKQLYEEGTVRDSSCGACIKIFASSGGTTPNPRDDDKQDDDNNGNNDNNNNGNGSNNNDNNNDNSSGSSGGGGGCELGASAFVMLLLVMVFFRKMLL